MRFGKFCFGLMLFAIVGCGDKESEKSQQATLFRYVIDTDCKTEQTFDTRDAYCKGLKDEELNNGCGMRERREIYLKKCGEDWSELGQLDSDASPVMKENQESDGEPKDGELGESDPEQKPGTPQIGERPVKTDFIFSAGGLRHQFLDLEAYCAGLNNHVLWNNRGEETRKIEFEKHCEGDWIPQEN